MQEALDLAAQAAREDEVPVGAVIVSRGRVVGRGRNRREQGKDATLHAELCAVREACATLGGWRIPEATISVTLEPCPMCAGALVNARVQRLVYAAPDPKAGAAGTVMNIADHPALNHRLTVESGLLAEESAALLRDFFGEKRARQQAEKRAQQAAAADSTPPEAPFPEAISE